MVAMVARRCAERSSGVSVINKMLQELDRRNASAGIEAEQPPQQVKAVSTPHRGHAEWFWRIVAVLMLAAVGWVGWVAYQLRPQAPVATELAFKAAEQSRKGPITPAVPSAVERDARQEAVEKAPALAEKAPSPSTKPAPLAQEPAPSEPAKPAVRESAETFKLAQAIQTPIAERQPPKPEPAPARPAASAPAPEAAQKTDAAPAAKMAEKPKIAQKKVSSKPMVDKRDHAKAASESAEQQFRRAALYLNQGRVSEAEDQLVGALHADPSHVAARQAYVALLLEQRRNDAAQRVLRDALAKDPSQPVFSLALARILAEQHDYMAALDVMDRAGGVSKNADFQAVRGAVMQRLGRHQEAVDAYLAAIQGGVQPATTWVGLGISLEALGRRSEASQAYRRSLGGALTREVRDYAESRVRALD
jgi:Tfp pilus assembly protein PilF